MNPGRARTSVILFLAGMLLIHVLVFAKVWRQLRAGYPDFTIFYTAGLIVRQGLGSHLYESGLQFRIQQGFAAVPIRKGPLPFNHPPFEALAFVPLTYLPYFAAYLTWVGINLLILISLPALVRPWLAEFANLPRYFWMLGFLGYFPIFLALVQGQDVIVLLLLYALSFAAMKRRRDFAAGCWLALGLFKFHLVVPTIFILLLQGRRKALYGFLIVGVVLALVSTAAVGWNSALGYPAYLWKLERSLGQAAIAPADMPNLRGLLSALPGVQDGTTSATALVVSLSLLLLILAALSWRRTRGGTLQEAGSSLALVTTILVSYHSYAYDLSLLILPILLVSNCAVRQTDSFSRADKVLLLGPIAIMFFSPLYLVLLFRLDRFDLMALVLLLWMWGISRETRKAEFRDSHD